MALYWDPSSVSIYSPQFNLIGNTIFNCIVTRMTLNPRHSRNWVSTDRYKIHSLQSLTVLHYALTTPQAPHLPSRLRVWVTRSAIFHLHNINLLRPSLTPSSTATLIQALVTSRIDYCFSLLFGLPQKCLHKVQVVQNSYPHLNPLLWLHHPCPQSTPLAPGQILHHL